MAQQSPNMWAVKLVESLDQSMKKKSIDDKLHDKLKKRLNESQRDIIYGFTQVVMQIQSESSGNAWGAAAEIAGAFFK